MTNKRLSLATIAIIAVACSAGLCLYSSWPSESEKLFDSLEIGTNESEVTNELKRRGFTCSAAVMELGPIFYFRYRHEQDAIEISVCFEDGTLARKKLDRPESFFNRTCQRIVDWVSNKPEYEAKYIL